MTIFYLVRHAVTEHTGRKLSGWMPDIHLTDEGRAQADAVAERLSRVRLQAVYSSPIERTMETARPIATRHRLPIRTRRRLGEVAFGRWEDRSFGTLRRTKLWGLVQHVPSAARFPDGETFRDVQARAVDEIERIGAEHPRGAVCCVSHADVIKLIVAHYMGLHIDLFQRLAVGPASISVIAVTGGRPMVVALNSSGTDPSEARA